MTQFAIAGVVVTALALCSVAFAGGTFAGKYTTKIAGPAQVKGTWVLNFAAGGTYTVARDSKVVIHGKYSTRSSQTVRSSAPAGTR